jgi:anaerobic selenocysteine-containing dehydrogenase
LVAESRNGCSLGLLRRRNLGKSDWHFPAAHYLESWGDATTSDGTLVPVQPLIQPLFGGLTELEFLARIAGESQTNPYEIVVATFGVWDGSEETGRNFCSTVF